MAQQLGAPSTSTFPPDLVAVLSGIATSLKQIAAALKRIEKKMK